ncbi:MAG: heavy metal translocating P-type ATPase [Acidimicrobiales bacterium]
MSTAAPHQTGTAPQDLAEVELSLQGMTCAACANRIEKALNKVDGVEAAVNYATETAMVAFTRSTVTEQRLVEAVRAAGYDAHVMEDEPVDDDLDDRLRALRMRLGVAVGLALPVALLSMLPAFQFDGWQWWAFALSTPVATWAAWPFHRVAAVNLRHGTSNMDTLISVGVIAAMAWSIWALVWGGAEHVSMAGMSMSHSDGAHVYFEVAATVTAFILAGRYLETRAKHTAGSALRSLLALGARHATVLRDGAETHIPASVVRMDDIVVVRPGEKIAVDGVVEDGASAVDASTITGESVPVEVSPGSVVTAATVNLNGRLLVRPTRIGSETTFARMARMVREAQATKAPVQRVADRVSAVFVPVVMVISLATLVVGMIVGRSTDSAFSAAVAVLIIACPCALGLATPTALMVGSGRAAQMGIVIRGIDVLQSTRRIDTVVLDKTGTVTAGRMTLVDVVCAPGAVRADALRLGGAVEQGSEHPIGRAVAEAAAHETPVLPQPEGFAALVGAGAIARVDGIEVTVGREELARERGMHIAPELTAALGAARDLGHTAVVVGWEALARAVFVVADQPKPSSSSAVAELKSMGLAPVLLTGDNERTARAVAVQVGIDTDEHHLYAGVMPEDKVSVVRGLQERGYAVAMVGDGVNDAAALAQADVGIAMGGGTDVAMQASDLTIVSGDLRLVADAIRLSRATLRTIKANVFWAFAYNVAAIPLAAAGMMNPMWAGLAMASSSVFVVTNSLRLRRVRLTH